MSNEGIQVAIFDGWHITYYARQAISAAGLPYGAQRVTVNAIHQNTKDKDDPMLLVLKFDSYDRPNQRPLEQRIAAYLEPILAAINSEILPF